MSAVASPRPLVAEDGEERARGRCGQVQGRCGASTGQVRGKYGASTGHMQTGAGWCGAGAGWCGTGQVQADAGQVRGKYGADADRCGQVRAPRRPCRSPAPAASAPLSRPHLVQRTRAAAAGLCRARPRLPAPPAAARRPPSAPGPRARPAPRPGPAAPAHLDAVQDPAALQRLHQQVSQLHVLLRSHCSRCRRHLASPRQPPSRANGQRPAQIPHGARRRAPGHAPGAGTQPAARRGRGLGGASPWDLRAAVAQGGILERGWRSGWARGGRRCRGRPDRP